jgi:hypothetical protein
VVGLRAAWSRASDAQHVWRLPATGHPLLATVSTTVAATAHTPQGRHLPSQPPRACVLHTLRAGISLRTQELYAVVFFTRYLDLLTNFVSV